MIDASPSVAVSSSLTSRKASAWEAGSGAVCRTGTASSTYAAPFTYRSEYFPTGARRASPVERPVTTVGLSVQPQPSRTTSARAASDVQPPGSAARSRTARAAVVSSVALCRGALARCSVM